MTGVIIGAPLCIMYFLIKLYKILTNRNIKISNILLLMGILGVALFAAQIAPPFDWDLYRHYDEINRIRAWGLSYAWNESRYAHYIGATFLFYITSLTPWNETLPFLTVFIELFIYESVMSHYKDKISAQSEGICFFLFLVLSNMALAISGIRNVLAAILLSYAIFDFECVKKHFVFDFFIVAFAISIHPASAFLLIVYIISYIPSLLVGSIISLCLLPISINISNNLLGNDNIVVSSTAGLFNFYNNLQSELDIRVLITSAILILLSIFVLLKLKRWIKFDRYLKYSLLYSLATIGMISQGLIYSRMLYGLSLVYPILVARNCCYTYDGSLSKLIYSYKWYCIIYCAGMFSFQGYELIRAVLIK